MNKQRRESIKIITQGITNLKNKLEAIQGDEEQELYENMSEGLQSSERGEQSRSANASLGNALINLDDAIDKLETIE